MKKLLLSCTLLALTASLASAQVQVSWNECEGSGNENEVFTCTVNAGTFHNLVTSFTSPANLTAFVGSTSNVELVSGGAAMPDWWRGDACRLGQFNSVDPSGVLGLVGCVNPFDGAGLFSGLVVVQNGVNGDVNRQRIQWDAVRDSPAQIAAGAQAIAGALEIRNAKTTGTGACAGCATPVCLVVKAVSVYQVSGTPPQDTYVLSNPATPAGANYATWQGGAVGGAGCPGATPAKNATWGQIKSTYR